MNLLQHRPAVRAPQDIAKDAADRYFAALAADIPFDTHNVNLIEAVNEVQDALLKRYPDDVEFTREDAALRAGYILGVEIGSRMTARR